MSIALFGGTFDPPHCGHLAIAKAAADTFGLGQILFAPTGRQPLKAQRACAPFDNRLEMTRLACAQDSRFVASDIDAPRPGDTPNYTVETLARLQLQRPGQRLYNLVGADSFEDLARWRQPQQLLALAEWIVVSRPGFTLASPLGDPPGLTLTHLQRTRIYVLDSIHEDVAASTLRERLHLGDPCADLLPATVSAYIQQHHLYLGVKP
jgi:nicotinate-nucleotide adenylyltransferase